MYTQYINNSSLSNVMTKHPLTLKTDASTKTFTQITKGRTKITCNFNLDDPNDELSSGILSLDLAALNYWCKSNLSIKMDTKEYLLCVERNQTQNHSIFINWDILKNYDEEIHAILLDL
jgi:hypothetical protein